ncbi:MAG: ParB/Srx family N-terminal domain-containing protein [Bacteroidota bacterium]|nr:ParB/Srx family N-terminal domain-containing protein [Bacteroidota bacterium]
MKETIKFRDQIIPFDSLYLDPNNPRFLSMDDPENKVPADRIKEIDVQEAAFQKMLRPEFQVRALRDSILEIGYLPMDRIVVSKLDDDSFVVIEGNRRLAAIRWIEQMIKEGAKDKSIRATYENLTVSVLDSESDTDINRLKVQGVRHISEARPWGTYQKAQLIRSLIENEGLSPQDVALAIGYRTQEVNRIYSAYLLHKQMQDDEDYGQYATPEHINYFYELVGRKKLREFFGYDNETGLFEEEDNDYHLFFKWIIEDPDNGHRKKLNSTRDVRELTKIIASSEAWDKLLEDRTSITEALAVALKYNTVNWKKEVTQAIDSLEKIPLDQLEKFNEGDIELLNKLKSMITKRVAIYDQVKGI